jgi:hypothetical protein
VCVVRCSSQIRMADPLQSEVARYALLL